MKKNTILYLFSTIFIFFLTACSDKSNWKDDFRLEADDKENISSEDNLLLNNSETSDVYKPTWIDIAPEDMPYQYANMFKSVSGAFVIDLTEKILFEATYQGKPTLMEYKKDFGHIETFCKLATCSHNTDECVAGNVYQLDYRNQILCAGRTQKDADIWISQLKNGRFEFVAGPVNSFVQGDDGYYCTTKDASLVRFKFGSDKPQLLVEKFQYIKPVILGNYLYAANEVEVVRVDLRGSVYNVETVISDVISCYSTDGNHLYYLKMESEKPALYRCDLKGNNQELVLNKLIFPTYLSYDDTYIYYSTTNSNNSEDPTNGDIYRFSKDLSGEPELLCKTYANYPVVYVLPTSPDTLLVEANNFYYFLPKTGGELIELVLP